MSKEKHAQGFEERLEFLEKLTVKMEEGQLGLEETLALYEQGIQLANGLKAELETAQARLMELKDGKIKPVELP